MSRIIFLLHRYLGIAIGIVLLLWSVSGFVMMYVQYPELSPQDRLQNLPELNLQTCCQLPAVSALEGLRFDSAQVELLADSPVLRLLDTDARRWTIDLAAGRLLDRVGEEQAHAIARQIAALHEREDTVQYLGQLNSDQWTVVGAYNAHRPLYRYALNDEGGTQLYLSSTTGELVLMTTRHERVWNYAGSVIHWLYPALLRQHPVLWSQTVIYLSLIGIFLTLTGLYIGIKQFEFRRAGRSSSYRGLNLWHHYVGLFFGVLTLTWLLSGLLSMNPWGVLESRSFRAEFERLRGDGLSWSALRNVVSVLPSANLQPELIHLEIAPSAGIPYIIASDREGQQHRLSADTFAPAELSETQLYSLGRRLLGGRVPQESDLMLDEDAYYYNHHTKLKFPVYRIISNDEENTRFYLDATSGQLLAAVDSNRRWYRWLFQALHRADFAVAVRSRPFWDIFMGTLLLGVTLVCATGTGLGLRRVLRLGS